MLKSLLLRLLVLTVVISFQYPSRLRYVLGFQFFVTGCVIYIDFSLQISIFTSSLPSKKVSPLGMKCGLLYIIPKVGHSIISQEDYGKKVYFFQI